MNLFFNFENKFKMEKAINLKEKAILAEKIQKAYYERLYRLQEEANNLSIEIQKREIDTFRFSFEMKFDTIYVGLKKRLNEIERELEKDKKEFEELLKEHAIVGYYTDLHRRADEAISVAKEVQQSAE